MIQTGDIVRVHPHGHSDQNALGIVALISGNQRSIAVAFKDQPPFVIIPGGALLGPGGVQLLAWRGPISLWVEIFAGGHYEIETAEILDGGRAIHCFRCGMTSHNAGDVENRYCGNCKREHDPVAVAVAQS